MGFVGVDELEFETVAGAGEEGPALFLRFAIAASMLLRSAMSERESSGSGWRGSLYTVREDRHTGRLGAVPSG